MTPNQLGANKKNSLRSIGSATEKGKKRLSRDVLRHMLTAGTALLPTEDPEAYRQHCQAFFHRFVARVEGENQLIQHMADVRWRMRRIPELEAALLEDGNLAGLSAVSLYEHRLLRAFERSLAMLQKLQDAATKEEPKNGFVFSEPPPKQMVCDWCHTECGSAITCEGCGKSDYLLPTAEFYSRSPIGKIV